MVEFGMDIKLSDRENALVRHIFEPIEKALIWTNDYWSFDRENDESQVYGHRLYNAVDVVMRTKFLSIAKAKLEVRKMVLECEKSYVMQKMQFYRDHPNISTDLRRWIEVAGCTVAGVHYWASDCDRNHAWRENSFHIVTRKEAVENHSTEPKTPDLDSPRGSVSSNSSADTNGESLMLIDSNTSTSEDGHGFRGAFDTKFDNTAETDNPFRLKCSITGKQSEERVIYQEPLELESNNSPGRRKRNLQPAANQSEKQVSDQTRLLHRPVTALNDRTRIEQSPKVSNINHLM
jgi:hypothetical protein